jgi:hypothetical protein
MHNAQFRTQRPRAHSNLLFAELATAAKSRVHLAAAAPIDGRYATGAVS